MRILVSSLLLVAACTVPDKQPATDDGGIDAPGDPAATPNTTITSAPAEFSNAGTAMFEFESDVPGSHFLCSVNGDPATECTSPFAHPLPDGAHSFSVRAVNGDGEADDTPAEHLWSIDTVAPITTLTEAPPAADNSTMVRYSFMANEMFVSFECSLDNGAFATCRTGDMFGPVGDGAHAFAVRAVDRAGNADASPAGHAWQVDTSTPDTTLLSGPSGSVASATATFTFLSPDAGTGSTFECTIDGSGYTACASPATYNSLAMGVHTFAVRVRDANGNYDPTPATRTWTADQTPPETTITDGPSGTVAMASVSISFTSNEALVTYACKLDGGAFAPCSPPFNATNLPQGAHSFAVIATDEAGNADPSAATASWTVDTTTPEVTLSGITEGQTSGPRIGLQWTVNEGTVECRVDGGAWFACTGSIAYNHPAGASSFELRATDAAGNQTTATRTWTVDCLPPDEVGAIGLLHLGDQAQVLVNTATSAAATLGLTDQVETVDPTFATSRFGDGLAFNAAEGDLVSWPLAGGTASTLSVDLWSAPAALTGTRDLFVSGDSRIALRVTGDNGSVRYSATVVDNSGVLHTTTSAAYAAGQWHNVVVSVKDPSLQLWVDGDVTTVEARGISIAADSVRIGGTYSGGIDEVWVGLGTLDTPTVLGRYCPATTVRL